MSYAVLCCIGPVVRDKSKNFCFPISKCQSVRMTSLCLFDILQKKSVMVDVCTKLTSIFPSSTYL